MNKFTTHIEFDVPDEKVGAVRRMLVNMKAENISQQPNGVTSISRGERAGKMHGASIRDVIFQQFQENGRLTKLEIMSAVKEAGYAPGGVNTPLTNLVAEKVIRRLSRGVYVLSQSHALPAPAKKA